MKTNEKALRYLALDLLNKIDNFDKDDTWEVLNSCLELVSEETEVQVKRLLKGMLKKSVSFAEEDEIERQKSSHQRHVFDLLEDQYPNAGLQGFSEKSGMAIQKALTYARNKDKKQKLVQKITDDIKTQITGTEDIVSNKLLELSKYFNLKETEVKFLILVYHETVNYKTGLGNIVSTNGDITEIFTGCSSSESTNLCSRSDENPLVLKGLMKFGRRNATILTEMVLEFINKDTPLDLTDMFLDRVMLDDCYPIMSFSQPEARSNALIRILRNKSNANILLHGVEGTGKTEFAKSICNEAGANCFFLRPFNDQGSDSLGKRRMGLFAAANLLSSLHDSILVVDEADKLLATDKQGGFLSLFLENVNDDEKAWTNQFLDQSKIRIIFIINRNSLDRSTLRRFNMMMEFDSICTDKTAEMVTKILKENHLEVNHTRLVDFIAENQGINIGSYALAAETAASVKDSDLRNDTFFQVLTSHHEVLGDRGFKRSLSKHFDENLLNLSVSQEKVLDAVKKHKSGIGHSQNLPMLFYGLPGTGKTEFAHQIAKRFGMTLDIYGGSELLDPYVGGTEKLIAKAFKKTSSNPNKILFIDEADSLFTSRANAEKSWMISQTNELLRQMENFKGIFIAATNFNTLMDEAAMRRFHLKIEFRPLTTEKTLQLYQSMFFSKVGALEPHNKILLGGLTNLTPGDFHSVWSKLSYEDKISHEDIIRELKFEASFKSRNNRITLK